MDGRSLLSFMDADDDYHPIAVMTPNGLRVVEIPNDDGGYLGWVWPSTDPESYQLVTQGSSIVLLTPSERLLAHDPPYLVMPLMIPGAAAHEYNVLTVIVNSDGDTSSVNVVLPATGNDYVAIYEV